MIGAMEREAKKSSEHLVNLMLDREIKHNKSRFSDIDIKDFQNQVRTKKMFTDLENRSVETQELKKEIKL